MAILVLGLAGLSVWAQAPDLAWATNLGARVFAVDEQTNVYANAGGTVFTLSSDGVPLRTNAFCPVPGLARRDSAGNYYFAGSFDGPVDFGGITLVGGWTNNNGHYSSGWPTCFLAKYGSNGSLQWVNSFGQQAGSNYLTSLALDPSGGGYAGYCFSLHNSATHISDSGAVDWTWTVGGDLWVYATKVGGATASNCCVLSVTMNYAVMRRLDRSGNATSLGQYPLMWRTSWCTNAEPVIDDSANPFQVGKCFTPLDPFCTPQWLRKYGSGGVLWDKEVSPDMEWTLARDPAGNIYLGGANGLLAKFTDSGDQVWSNNFVQPCVAMVTDGAGNRFVSFTDGTVARLQEDGSPQPVQIAIGPQSQTVFAGESVVLSVIAVGSEPLCYTWRRNGTDLPGATGAELHLDSAASSDSGEYCVVVSNLLNCVTSAPALLRVKSVQLYWGSQMLTNGNYVFDSPPTLTIRSAFTDGSIYYTLDGSPPTQSSTPYGGPFLLEHNATVRAIGYSADESQSEEADPIQATVYSQHTLTVTISGNGNLVLDPPGGIYPNTTMVTARAIPSPGWSFLFWLDDASGSSPSVSISMEYDRSIMAVFAENLPSEVGAPGLAWATNLGARVFAVDEQTNVYANAGGTVFTLSSDGVPLRTNAICPVPGLARRDSAGNYYFAGGFDGSVDFGGITVVGGWTNNNGHYSSGWPTCFLAKYGSNGSLQWVSSFGDQAGSNYLTSLVLDPSGGCYAGYVCTFHNIRVTYLSDSGAVDGTWTAQDYMGVSAVKVGGATASNCCVLAVKGGNNFASMARLDRSGNGSWLGQYPLGWRTTWSTNAEPVIDDSANPFQVGKCFTPLDPFCTPQWLRKYGSGGVLWDKEVSPDMEWTLARDPAGNVYLGGANGLLAKFTDSGDQVWSNNFVQPCVAMVTDTSANRFVSFTDGTVARLQEDVIAPSKFTVAREAPAEGSVSFSLTSEPQQVWQILVSTNLADWECLGTVTNNAGGLRFRDFSNGQAPARFYKAVPVP